MIRIIDRAENVVVQKVTKPDGSLVRYQYGVPGDASTFKAAGSLTEARIAIGKASQKPTKTSAKENA
jgi:hypothetical protein